MYAKIQGSGTLFRVGFALSKTPHLHRAYLVTVRKQKSMTVLLYIQVHTTLRTLDKASDFFAYKINGFDI